jgi:hypothetical protein
MCHCPASTKLKSRIDSYREAQWPIRLVARLLIIPIIAILCVAVGCGSSPYDLAEVRGKVTIDGRPLTGAKVMFAPVGSGGPQGMDTGKPAFGVLQADGSFVLGTYGEADGAIVGPHSVSILSLTESPAAVPISSSSATPKFRRMLVPRQCVVEAGKANEIVIELTQRDVAKFSQK